MAGINLQLEAVAGSLDTQPSIARRSLGVAQQMLRYSMDEARRSVMDLRSHSLEGEGLAGALEGLAGQMTLGTPLAAEVRVEGTPRPLDATQEHHLLRIGVEALTNAVKHAGASRIEIALRFAPDATELSVRDDGEGFEPPDAPGSGEHFGLRGIRERVDKLGGSLEIESAPRAGTRLTVRVPRAAAATAGRVP
jgi:signal transduction histidine kinase